jgi:uncharacterized protein (DUF2249 family)
MTQATHELDLRRVGAAELPARVLAEFDALPENGHVLLVTQDDPRPVYERLHRERDSVLSWAPLQNGPDGWKVGLTRVKPKDDESEIGAYFARDHDEIDLIFKYLHADVEEFVPCSGIFDEFNARLERHIRWEEEVLFPAVERRAPMLVDGPGRVMRMEHVEIRAFKAQAERMLKSSPPDFTRAIEALDAMAGVLIDHNRKEEAVYYPMSDQMFSAAEAATILHAVREIR